MVMSQAEYRKIKNFLKVMGGIQERLSEERDEMARLDMCSEFEDFSDESNQLDQITTEIDGLEKVCDALEAFA